MNVMIFGVDKVAVKKGDAPDRKNILIELTADKGDNEIEVDLTLSQTEKLFGQLAVILYGKDGK